MLTKYYFVLLFLLFNSKLFGQISEFNLSENPQFGIQSLDSFIYQSENSSGFIENTYHFVLVNNSANVSFHDLVIRGVDSFYLSKNKLSILPYLNGKKSFRYFLSIDPLSKDTFSFGISGMKKDLRISILDHSKSFAPLLKNFKLLNYNDIIEYGFLCIVLIFFIVAAAYYLYLRNTFFIIYGLYLLVVFLYYLISLIGKYYYFLDIDFYFKLGHLAVFFQVLFHVLYFYFINHILGTKTNYKYIHQCSKIVFWTSFVAVILMPLEIFIYHSLWLFTVYRLIVAIVAIAMLLYAFRQKEVIIRLISWGSLFLLIGSLVTLIMALLKLQLPINIDRIVFMKTGIVLELIFFNIALAYKTFFVHKEKMIVQDQLISAMTENQKLLENREDELKSKIEQATIEIKNKEKEQLLVQLALKEKELEMKVLRSQMNPHFLFNSINALKVFIMNNDKEAALAYFDNFAQLMRLTLSNSHDKKIKLSKELEILTLYVGFENMRLADKIHFNVIIDNNIDPDFTEIPAMIIQPFIENSIWHGLANKAGSDKKIELLINTNEDEDLFICITDNGIGRKAAERNKPITNHQSLGTLITNERLTLQNMEDNNIIYTDLYDEQGLAIGTQVNLTIKV